MTDTALPHIPRFDYGSSSIVLTYPVTRWIPGARTLGSVLKSADAVPGPVLRLRRYTLAMTLRFTEDEWPDVSDFINYGQTGAPFTFFHGEDNDDIPPSITCTLGAPRIAAGVRPVRDGSLPWMMTLPIVLETTEGWYLSYFGTSTIPIPPVVIPISTIDVELSDDSPDTTDIAVTATATLFDSNGDVIPSFGHLILWTSTDHAVATVDSDGLVTLQGPGTCDIIATCESITGSATLTVTGVPALVATGGTRIETGGFVYHVFDASGDFVVTSGSAFVELLLVAGGGGGGGSQDRTGGGGGAGGVRRISAIPLTPGTYPIIVGAGGVGGTPTTPSTNGSNSSALGNASTGGGKGAGFDTVLYFAGNGGSGGGFKHGGPGDTGGTGIAGQGFKGGDYGGNDGGGGSGAFFGSGGGGASEAGVDGSTVVGGGRGGNGVSDSITGTATLYGGGGGGSAANYGGQSYVGGNGGTGGGGAGATSAAVAANGTNGTDGLGGGGGGGARAGGLGGSGGRGVVIVRYPML
jgi:hypothetical protein